MKQNSAANEYVRRLVIEAAQKCIRRVDELRKEQIAEALSPWLVPYKKYWLFGPLVTRTQEQATEAVDNLDIYFATNAFHNQRDSAQLILNAAAAHETETFFWMTKEEFDDIRNWYNKGAA